MEENKNVNENVEEKVEESAEKKAEANAKGSVNETDEELKRKANEIVDRIKELVKEGNVTHIRIRKGDTIILNLPMTIGVVGTLLGVAAAPWAVIISTITTIGFGCTVEVQNKDGSVTVIYGKEN